MDRVDFSVKVLAGMAFAIPALTAMPSLLEADRTFHSLVMPILLVMGLARAGAGDSSAAAFAVILSAYIHYRFPEETRKFFEYNQPSRRE